MNKAQGPLVSYVLVILLTVSVAILIPIWAKPALDKYTDSTVFDEALRNLKFIDSVVKQVASESRGSARDIDLRVTDGVYEVNETNDWIQFDYDLKSDMKLEGTEGNIHIEMSPVFLDYFNHYIDGTETPAGWTKVSGNWSVSSGEYVQNATTAENYTVVGDSTWRDYTVEVKTKVKSGVSGWNESTILFRYNDGGFYLAGLGAFGYKYAIGKRNATGNFSLTGTGNRTDVSADTWYDLKVDIGDSSISLYVDGLVVLSTTDPDFSTGSIGLRTNSTYAYFDNVKVKTGENKVRFVIPYSRVDLNTSARFPKGTHKFRIETYGMNTTLNRPSLSVT